MCDLQAQWIYGEWNKHFHIKAKLMLQISSTKVWQSLPCSTFRMPWRFSPASDRSHCLTKRSRFMKIGRAEPQISTNTSMSTTHSDNQSHACKQLSWGQLLRTYIFRTWKTEKGTTASQVTGCTDTGKPTHCVVSSSKKVTVKVHANNNNTAIKQP